MTRRLVDGSYITSMSFNHCSLKAKSHSGAPGALVNIAQSIIMNNQVFDLLVHPGENSTYTLQFRAPQFQCTVLRHNSTILLEEPQMPNYGLISLAYASTFPSPLAAKTLVYSMSKHNVKSITTERSLNFTKTYKAHMETVEYSCKPCSMLHEVYLSFPRGVRSTKHTTSDPGPILDPVDIYDGDVRGRTDRVIHIDLAASPQALEAWRQRLIAALPVTNGRAILDALGSVLEVAWYAESSTPGVEECNQTHAFDNGTTIHECMNISNETEPSGNNTIGKSHDALR